VWIGNVDREQTVTAGGVGEVFGGTLPADVWEQTMNAALAGEPVIPFPRAAGVGSPVASSTATPTATTTVTPSETPTPTISPTITVSPTESPTTTPPPVSSTPTETVTPGGGGPVEQSPERVGRRGRD
jgi:membrane peptidoglycan carboxypeptidase